MEGQHIKGLMEAYSTIYSEPELLDEEVDMELEEDFEVLDEGSRNRFRKSDPEQVAANRTGLVNRLLYGNPEGRQNRVTTPRSRQQNRTSRSPRPATRPVANLPADYKQTELKAGEAAEKHRSGAGLPVSGGGNQGSNRPTASRPSTAPASKPATAKPVVKQTGDKAKDMAAWAKANPKLAAAKAERDRTRGTSATTNPLMKDMKSRLPAPKTLSKTDAGANFGSAVKAGQSMNNKPAPTSAAKPATTPAAKPAPTPAAKPAKRTPTQIRQGINAGVDIFDLVKGHLLDEGYAETEQAAMTIMANMSEEWRESIVEGLLGSGSGFLGSNAAELGAKGGHDALPWNRNTRYTTQGKPRKPGENIRGERIVNPPDKNKSTSAVTSDGKPR